MARKKKKNKQPPATPKFSFSGTFTKIAVVVGTITGLSTSFYGGWSFINEHFAKEERVAYSECVTGYLIGELQDAIAHMQSVFGLDKMYKDLVRLENKENRTFDEEKELRGLQADIASAEELVKELSKPGNDSSIKCKKLG